MESVRDKSSIFKEVARESGVTMHHDTHYDALNFEFSRIAGNTILRLDFQPTENSSFIVTKYTDHFPIFPRLFRFLHNTVPFFPYLAEIRQEQVAEITADKEDSALKEEIVTLVQEAIHKV